jgi:hypothetical protein
VGNEVYGLGADRMIIGIVPQTMVELIWDKVFPLIDMVQEKAPDDIVTGVVYDELISGKKLLVTISSGTEVIAINVLDVRTLDTGTKVLYIPITAGSHMEEWLEDFLEIAKAVAKDFNCVELRGLAVRNGWIKKLKPLGWEELFTTIHCKLGD